jgi:serpin B
MKLLLSLLIACVLLLLHANAAETKALPGSMSDADRTVVVEGNNAFALALYHQLSHQAGNLFFSPESISTALAMAYAGARGSTASEMAEALHFTVPQGQLHPAMGALLRDLNAAHSDYQLNVANALWAQQGYTFLDQFLNLLRTDYGAGLQQVDFKAAPEAARGTINQWVEQKTQDKIKDLLSPGSLKPDTRLVLTNAIYFMGNWQTQFDKAQTKNDEFYLSQTKSAAAPMMHREGSFGYFDGGTFQVLEIPYKSNALSLIVLLPKERGGLPGLEDSMTASKMQQWLSRVAPVPKVIVSVPRFKSTQEFELSTALRALGMPQAFGSGADFSGMTDKRDFAISAVIHKAFVDVNEEGTEAAAATAVTMRALAMHVTGPPPPVFRADHPFIFLSRDKGLRSILFMGRMTDPTN